MPRSKERAGSGSPFIKNGGQIPGSGGPINAAKATAAKVARADEFAIEIMEVIREMGGGSLREIADGLNNAGYRTRNGGEWFATSVKRILAKSRPEGNGLTLWRCRAVTEGVP